MRWALMLQTFANRARETDLAKVKGRPDQGGPRSRKERSPKFVVDYAIQNGLWASRCASQRVIPMSRNVASLKPSNSLRERERRCHSPMRRTMRSQLNMPWVRKLVIVVVVMAVSKSVR